MVSSLGRLGSWVSVLIAGLCKVNCILEFHGHPLPSSLGGGRVRDGTGSGTCLTGAILLSHTTRPFSQTFISVKHC